MTTFSIGVVTGTLASLAARAAVVALTAGLALGSSGGIADAQTMEEVKERGVLRAAGVVYRPFIHRKPSGEYVGIDVELLQGLAEELGVELEFVDTGWDTAVAGLTAGKYEVVTSLCDTEKRREVISFAGPIAAVGAAFAVRADDDRFDSYEDLNNSDITVAVTAGGAAERYADQFLPEAEKRAFTGGTQDQNILEVLSNRADAAVIDAPVGTAVADAAHPGRLQFFPSKEEPLQENICPASWGLVLDDPEWQAFVQDYVDAAHEDGTIDDLRANYFSADYLTNN